MGSLFDLFCNKSNLEERPLTLDAPTIMRGAPMGNRLCSMLTHEIKTLCLFGPFGDLIMFLLLALCVYLPHVAMMQDFYLALDIKGASMCPCFIMLWFTCIKGWLSRALLKYGKLGDYCSAVLLLTLPVREPIHPSFCQRFFRLFKCVCVCHKQVVTLLSSTELKWHSEQGL